MLCLVVVIAAISECLPWYDPSYSLFRKTGLLLHGVLSVKSSY